MLSPYATWAYSWIRPPSRPDAGPGHPGSSWVDAPPGGRSLAQRPVRAMNVIVLDVLTQDQPQVPFAGDQHPVQALSAGTGNPALRDSVRTRRPDRRPDDPHADRGEHGIERRGELGVPVPDQELETPGPIVE